ncbi:hypothetical protein [Fimbriiglobus ruber]|uniref:hypothetical protein n=1 Tax=Fimbriiglobus ruber TaxID=1908690 RepID=UPI000B4AAB8A|nr:hypothetical protein [Fimbriiglobus ruber]
MIDALLLRAREKGTDEEFRAWVQKQPSCISARFSEWLDDIGEWRNPACHVRRAGKSGTAYKEPYACIPLTHEEHRIQHDRGEAACLNRFLGGEWSSDVASDWFDEQRLHYLRMWVDL